MKLKTWIWSALLLIGLAGCSGDPYEKYIGLWERTDRDGNEVMQITRDGESLLMNGNVVRTTDAFGNEKKEKLIVLTKSDGQLSVDSMFGNSVFGLSEDHNTLRVASQAYTKIDVTRLDEIKSTLEKLAIEKKSNQQECKVLREKYNGLRQAVNKEYADDWQTKGKELKILLDMHTGERSKIPNCAF